MEYLAVERHIALWRILGHMVQLSPDMAHRLRPVAYHRATGLRMRSRAILDHAKLSGAIRAKAAMQARRHRQRAAAPPTLSAGHSVSRAMRRNVARRGGIE